MTFDPGPIDAFRDLCEVYPDDTVYKNDFGFRSAWGPIFYRGRATGSARLLVIGQDPAQTEAITRRCLCGRAGRRAQGFVQKLGYTKSYLMINAFVYAIENQNQALPHLNDPAIQAYRHKWLDAAFAHKIEAVITFGNPARDAWNAYVAATTGPAKTVFHQHALHPTASDSSGGTITVANQLDNWNTALAKLSAAIKHPDQHIPLVPYGTEFLPSELPEIPEADLPMGLPPWMRSADGWATMPTPPGNQRANILVTIP
ncbi:MAG: hypothetical protein QM831_21205 [Kofleriaceae bacterium]